MKKVSLGAMSTYPYSTRGVAAFILAMLLAVGAGAAEADGPYIFRDTAGHLEARSVDITSEGPRARSAALQVGGKVSVPAVGSLPAFEVTLRAPAENSPDIVTAPKKAPLFVVADTHGEYEILAQMLQKQRVVDAKLRWSFGQGQLVVLGDVFDRGAHQTEILWLLYELEAQARKKGGAVHLVLGNHETMVLGNDLRYLHPRYLETASLLGVPSYAALFAPDTVLGQWLRSKAAVLKINDQLALHGGISPQVVERQLSLGDINGAIRGVLNGGSLASDAERERAAFLFGRDGPLWYRGYFAGDGVVGASARDIDRMLGHFKVARILVGHTRVPTITPLYGGKVIAVQVYPRQEESGLVSFEALLIRAGVAFRALPDGSVQPIAP